MTFQIIVVKKNIPIYWSKKLDHFYINALVIDQHSPKNKNKTRNGVEKEKQ